MPFNSGPALFLKMSNGLDPVGELKVIFDKTEINSFHFLISVLCEAIIRASIPVAGSPRFFSIPLVCYSTFLHLTSIDSDFATTERPTPNLNQYHCMMDDLVFSESKVIHNTSYSVKEASSQCLVYGFNFTRKLVKEQCTCLGHGIVVSEKNETSVVNENFCGSIISCFPVPAHLRNPTKPHSQTCVVELVMKNHEMETDAITEALGSVTFQFFIKLFHK